MFIDEAQIEVSAGDGGDGAVSLRHEKYAPRGGPDGGDGGRGGDVIVTAAANLRTLIDCTYRTRYRAGAGVGGGRNRRQGKDGADVIVRLPVGTVVRDSADGALIVDLTHDGQQVVVARGGRGGRGNAGYATATRRTPRFAEKGEPAQHRHLLLELKLLADVGVIGLPNVGKSSLIARVSAARPKIADYPFTTLVPNLALVRIEEGTSFVIADLPGLVEGAHQGKGRGHGFLRHAERTRLFIHVLDAAAPDRNALDDFETLNRELALYREDLAERRQLVALNKMDLLPPPETLDRMEASLREQGYDVFRISALTGAGVSQLMGRAAQALLAESDPKAEQIPAEQQTAAVVKRHLRVERVKPNRYEVTGEDVERVVVMTDMDNEEGVRYLHRRLERMGVIRRLRDLGAKDGDQVTIGAVDLDFVD